MTIHSPRFLLACCRFSEEKNKVHLKKKEGNFVRVFPLPMLKKKMNAAPITCVLRGTGNRMLSMKYNSPQMPSDHCAFFDVERSPRLTVWGREQSPEQCQSLGLIPSVQKRICQSRKLSNVLCQRQFQHSVWPLRWPTEKPVLLSLSP